MKILVLEDEKKVAKFIKRGLEEEGYEVDVAHDGESGHEQIMSGMYGLVILDVMLPKKDGLTLVKELRAKNILIPVLMLTAKDAVDDIVTGFEAGADDYLKKPFDFSELLARVRALQRRVEHERGARLYFADLCLDPVSHEVWCNQTEIEMTAKEYELLEYLVRNQNQPLSRNMIADAVWEGAFDKFTNIIDVYINYLRKKLDKVSNKKLIHTVRGVGYMLKEEG